jgi:hypothetical protein
MADQAAAGFDDAGPLTEPGEATTSAKTGARYSAAAATVTVPRDRITVT